MDRDRHTIQVDFIPYMDTLAELIGCKPNVISAFGVLKEFLLGPVWPPQFRLRGPHCKPEIAKEAMRISYAQISTEVPGRRGAGSLWMEDVDRTKKSNGSEKKNN